MSLFSRRPPEHRHNAPTIELEGVSVAYSDRPALEDISFQLRRGERVAVVGPNGAGKSTLFNVIVGTIQPSAGQVHIYGSGPAEHTCIGYVPQRNSIDWRFPVTVWDVVMMGRTARIGLLRRPGRQDRLMVEQALAEAQADHLARRQIGELSGGQQQRVFLARALAQEAEVLLLDEPLTGLDTPSQQAVLSILDGLGSRGIGVLVATHDLGQAAQFYHRILLLNRRLIGDGPPAQLLTSQMLSRAYGSHLHILPTTEATIALADECCSDEEMGAGVELTG
ncbi:MAG: metal ABC transporter ATP-binding protein [Caldilineaceae bacterium]|nr:metal ABC transporter ATP-binding protein [Caldilineaceae bacterium]HRJ40397.1 metal ABC transporter ATP-binding protein [Caldilineaceae bacterium]